MTEKHFILAMAGHVDHGKSALVKALTGTDPDRLPEEKARKITIDLGFAELILDRPNEPRFRIGIVDVPGHEDFIRNMIAGIGSVDLALLVVAADDGWMPQTEEHLQILAYLGVKRVVVALTKSDIGDTVKTESEVRDKLRGTAFANAPLVRTSVRPSTLTALSSQSPEAGIAELKNAITSELSQLQPSRDIGKPRLFVDRAFTLRGIGTVVTGTLTGGTFSQGQTVLIQPRNLTSRIRSIQIHRRDVLSAGPGTRTALRLTNVEASPGEQAVRRGDAITIPTLGPASEALEVVIERSSRINLNSPAAHPIKNRSSVYLHHGTTRVAANIIFLENESLACGEHAIAELRLQSPILAFIGDRFVLRDPSERFTIGGGMVLDVGIGDRKYSQPGAQSALLFSRAAVPHDPEICIQTDLARRGFAERGTLLRQSNFSNDEIVAALASLSERGAIVASGEIVAIAERWRSLSDRASALIDTFHRQHPEQRGLPLANLRASLNQSPAVFEAVVTELCREGFVRERSLIARKFHRAALPVGIRPAAEKIRAVLAEKPFDPPSRRELAQDLHHQRALRFLVEEGEVLELTPDLVVLKAASDQMQNAIAEFISRHGPAITSQLRQHLGTSRRVIVPFLEYLDRVGITQRRGDHRVLRAKSPVAG